MAHSSFFLRNRLKWADRINPAQSDPIVRSDVGAVGLCCFLGSHNRGGRVVGPQQENDGEDHHVHVRLDQDPVKTGRPRKQDEKLKIGALMLY